MPSLHVTSAVVNQVRYVLNFVNKNPPPTTDNTALNIFFSTILAVNSYLNTTMEHVKNTFVEVRIEQIFFIRNLFNSQ